MDKFNNLVVEKVSRKLELAPSYIEWLLSIGNKEALKEYNEAQQSVHLTASGAGGRGQNPLQSSFIADDPSAKHGGR